IAAARGDVALVRLLLEAGASVKVGELEAMFIGTYGVFILPLYRAKDPQVIALLLDKGADPDIVLSPVLSEAIDRYGEGVLTPLEVAVGDKEVEVTRLLLERGVSFRDDGSGDKELRRALEHEDTTITALLLARGARLNAPDDLPEHLTQDQRRLLLAAEI